jgi:spectinomycin phosphotransferase
MNEAPADLDTDQLLQAVRRSWHPAVDMLTHLPVGFGAHHWRADVGGRARYFVTLDNLGAHHTLQTLQSAYAGAAALLEAGLTFVIAAIEPYAVPLAGRAISVTPWLEGTPVASIDEKITADMLRQLHAVDPADLGVDLPTWQPIVGPELVDHIAECVQRPWSEGPYGERSRQAVASAHGNIVRWTARYLELGRRAQSHRWVPTHGEPDWHNQLITASGTVLVDWETLKLAPAERDLQTLGIGDPAMLEMFDLEWRLDEISQYTTWFAGPHGDTADDSTAFDSLLEDLTCLLLSMNGF